ncbi:MULTISPECIES: hypothetical protein [Paraburkholderia]|uniref:Transmembrane protein n=1 Tax=Paraburkholderia madseniana TaxID=2599607 RepID=A0AAP5BFW2_9BURK|nr:MULTISPECIES: hypothetical protein [Paraburkholderia]MCX4149021.1 hypothetical protein [Paraburkholderia madseniana]MDN7151958.1 hypothetical protein [Paraburkholderia sp. WS6]MDQ6410838.1 hypothetical protein [Paraburkholderia madseniana]
MRQHRLAPTICRSFIFIAAMVCLSTSHRCSFGQHTWQDFARSYLHGSVLPCHPSPDARSSRHGAVSPLQSKAPGIAAESRVPAVMPDRFKEPVRYLTLFKFAGMAVFLTACLMRVLTVMRGRRMMSRCRQHADEEQIA